MSACSGRGRRRQAEFAENVGDAGPGEGSGRQGFGRADGPLGAGAIAQSETSAGERGGRSGVGGGERFEDFRGFGEVTGRHEGGAERFADGGIAGSEGVGAAGEFDGAARIAVDLEVEAGDAQAGVGVAAGEGGRFELAQAVGDRGGGVVGEHDPAGAARCENQHQAGVDVAGVALVHFEAGAGGVVIEAGVGGGLGLVEDERGRQFAVGGESLEHFLGSGEPRLRFRVKAEPAADSGQLPGGIAAIGVSHKIRQQQINLGERRGQAVFQIGQHGFRGDVARGEFDGRPGPTQGRVRFLADLVQEGETAEGFGADDGGRARVVGDARAERHALLGGLGGFVLGGEEVEAGGQIGGIEPDTLPQGVHRLGVLTEPAAKVVDPVPAFEEVRVGERGGLQPDQHVLGVGRLRVGQAQAVEQAVIDEGRGDEAPLGVGKAGRFGGAGGRSGQQSRHAGDDEKATKRRCRASHAWIIRNGGSE